MSGKLKQVTVVGSLALVLTGGTLLIMQAIAAMFVVRVLGSVVEQVLG